MSASKEKRVRTEQRGEGIDRKAAAEVEADKKNKRFKRNVIICVVIFVILLAAAIFINSNYLFNKAPAVKIGDTEYSAVELNYYYKTMYSNYCEQYGDYISLFFDTTQPLDEQQYSDTQTWQDYFYELAVNQMTQVTALYDAAMASGYELTDDDEITINNYVGYMQLYASANGTTTDAFLALNYGDGMNTDIYTDIITKSVVSTSYGQSVYDSYEYTADELGTYYSENAADLDIFTFNTYYIGISSDAFADLDDEAKKTAAHDSAAAIADAETAEEFAENVYNYVDESEKESYEDDGKTQYSYAGSSVSSTYKEWLTDSARVPFETSVFDTDNGSYAVMFVAREDNSYNTVSARHILFEAEADSDGNYTDEALAAAKEKAEALYETWKEDPTEENFITLANENSEDTGAGDGGLYENIYKGLMVDEFDAFCFADGVKAGDTAVVFGSTSEYAGYHIVYFVGEGQPYCDYLADQHLRSEEYSAYLDEIAAGYTVESKFANRFTDFSVS